MKKLLESYGARTAAFVLCCALALTALVCAAGFAFDYYEPRMGETDERDFFNSEMAYSYAQTQVWNALQRVYMLENETGSDEYMPPEPEESFSYVITRGDGTIAADTRTPGSRRICTETEFDWESGYKARCYVNLPAPRGTVLYGYVTLYDFLYNSRTLFLPVGLGCLLLTVLLFVFLIAAAGRTPEGVKLGGLHRWPLEIYLLLLGAAAAVCIAVMTEIGRFELMRHPQFFAVVCGLLILGAGVSALLGCMTLAARFRAGKWWRNTVTFFCCKWAWRLTKWCWRILAGAVRALRRALGAFLHALPLMGKTTLCYGAFTLLNVVLSLNAVWNGEGWLVLLFLIDAAAYAAVIWVTLQLKKLQAAGRALAAGDLSVSVDTKRMLPVLREHAENLEAVSLGMTRAVNERMKSERLKTELITNVSHDLKTPLTSIVSYVDLLKKEPIENERAREYIEVLDRQSQRLKKLTTDLVDASKASSGAMTVEPEPVDLCELVRQCAGEYAERLTLAQLTLVTDLPEKETVVIADGRLLWRVLDNLLTNAVKYAMPGTRVYAAVADSGGKTVLSLKNISREALNIPAEELLERFVRGDASRSSEGSGLGLSIARSLMELMGGELRLTLDGDLFKAELIF
ncbi:MAG: HAMP domain-containing histidine kinase [Oscillospiraceae bacterium]|nr:HAMP domain-containing histidine kinase [Oscillospiraceae bacterium]